MKTKFKDHIFLLLILIFSFLPLESNADSIIFDSSYYTINPLIKEGDSVLYKFVKCQMMLTNGTFVPYIQTGLIIPENATLNVTINRILADIIIVQLTHRYENGSVINNNPLNTIRAGIGSDSEIIVMTTNLTLITDVFSTLTNFTFSMTENEIIMNRSRYISPVNEYRVFRFDKETGWLKNIYVRYYNATFSNLLEGNLTLIKINSLATISNENSISFLPSSSISSHQSIISSSNKTRTIPNFGSMILIMAITFLLIKNKRRHVK